MVLKRYINFFCVYFVSRALCWLHLCIMLEHFLFLFKGMVYVDKNVVGWRPLAKAWLENRTQQEVHVSFLFVWSGSCFFFYLSNANNTRLLPFKHCCDALTSNLVEIVKLQCHSPETVLWNFLLLLAWLKAF